MNPHSKKIIDDYISKKLKNKEPDSDDIKKYISRDDTHHDGVPKDIINYDSNIFSEDPGFKSDEKKDNVLERKNAETSVEIYRKFLSMSDFQPDSYSMCFETSANLKKGTVVEITSTNKTHAHNTNGLFDKRLGPMHGRSTCVTCYMGYRECDGHSGWIPFPEKIPLPTTIDDYGTTCECICWHCFKPFATLEFIEILELQKYKGSVYRKMLSKHSQKLKSLHNHKNYKHEKFVGVIDNNLVYTREGSEMKYQKDIDLIFKVFSEMSKENLKILGFTAGTVPTSYIMEGIVLIPSRLRAPIVIGDMHQEHYLTLKYYEIMKTLSKIDKEKRTKLKSQYVSKLYQKVDELINGVETKGFNKHINAIFNLLSGKTKLIRRNAQGKRTDGSARFVAGPHTECDIDEVGYPEIACDNMFYSEVVHMYNIDRIIEELKRGVYQKVNVVIKGKKVLIPLKLDSTFIPEFGNVVLRTLKNGDLILFGRQPSLHKPSILAVRIKKIPDKVIRMPSPLAPPQNCDFDGDELHSHVPFTTKAKIEMAILASVPANIPNVESNRAMISPAFHAVLYAFYATEKWVYYDDLNIEREKEESQIDYMKRVKTSITEEDKHEFVIPERRFPELLACIKSSHRTKTYLRRCEKHGVNPYSGRGILSVSFPTNLTYCSEGLKIKDGILIDGVLKSSNISRGHGSIVQVIYKLFSVSEATRFISDFSRITDWLTMWASFSTGHHSFSTNRKEIKETLEVKLNKMQIDFYNLGEEPKDAFDLFYWNKNAHSIVDESLIYAKSVGNSYLLPNNGLNMLSGNGSGGKGSEMNTSQITAFLGVQKVKGDFQKKELNEGTRILPCFLPGDCSLQSRFFIVNSFFDGLTPSEQFGHLCSSREGLLDTAAKTPETGFTRRRIIKAMENIIMSYSGQIETTLGKIIDFTYDGFCPGMEVLVTSPETGKIAFFCDFKQHADYINGIYEYISEFMPEVDPDGNLNPDYDDEDEDDDMYNAVTDNFVDFGQEYDDEDMEDGN